MINQADLDAFQAVHPDTKNVQKLTLNGQQFYAIAHADNSFTFIRGAERMRSDENDQIVIDGVLYDVVINQEGRVILAEQLIGDVNGDSLANSRDSGLIYRSQGTFPDEEILALCVRTVAAEEYPRAVRGQINVAVRA